MSSAVLLMAFGGPDCIESVGPFMARLMGREPDGALVAAVSERYRAIGGCSPLPAIAGSIAARLAERLEARGHGTPVAVGMRYWNPSISDSIGRLARDGVNRLVTVSLSPFESKVSSGAYREAVTVAKEELPGLTVVEAPMLHTAPAFTDALVLGAETALRDVSAEARTLVVFSAHSLPIEDLVADDPYVREIRGTASKMARSLGLGDGQTAAAVRLGETEAWGSLAGERPWVVAYQSKGRRPGAWLEPDLDEIMRAAAEQGYQAVVVCPVGFATDHMETVYDLDIVAAERARELGLAFVRAGVPNDSDQLIEALVSLVEPSI